MKPTPTQIEAAFDAYLEGVYLTEDQAKASVIRIVTAALSVPAEAVVGEPEGWKLVPIEPTDELLRSMAIRSDHGLGVPGYYDQPSLGNNHARRMEVTISNMRQLYEEIVGKGFHRSAPSAPDGWQPIETAPKDGATIWVLDEIYGKPWHYECNWNGIEWYHGFGVAWPEARAALGGKP